MRVADKRRRGRYGRFALLPWSTSRLESLRAEWLRLYRTPHRRQRLSRDLLIRGIATTDCRKPLHGGLPRRSPTQAGQPTWQRDCSMAPRTPVAPTAPLQLRRYAGGAPGMARPTPCRCSLDGFEHQGQRYRSLSHDRQDHYRRPLVRTALLRPERRPRGSAVRQCASPRKPSCSSSVTRCDAVPSTPANPPKKGWSRAFNSLDAQREACEAYISSQRHEGWMLPAHPV